MSVRINIAKLGKVTDKHGTEIELTEAILSDIARSYDPKLHEAPYVIGHPQDNTPAFGWAAKLEYADGKLNVIDGEADPALIELYEGGKFKKISLSAYQPDSPGNPAPGHYYLRHVGFLGAMPPAIKGLDGNAKLKAAISLSEEGEKVLDCTDYDQLSVANLFRRLREFLIAKYGREEADKVVPDYEVSSLSLNAIDRDQAHPLRFSERTRHSPPEGGDSLNTPKTAEQLAADKAAADRATLELAEREAKVKADADALAAREANIVRQENEARQRSNLEFADGLVKEGKLLAVEKAGVVAVLGSLGAQTAVIEFGEGDAKKKQTPTEILTDFLKGLPKRVEFSEVAGGKPVDQKDLNPEDVAKAAVEFQESERKAGREISAAQAVLHVTQATEK